MAAVHLCTLLAPFTGMAERRPPAVPRSGRLKPGQAMDVTRLEHENLCGQMDEMIRMVRRIEAELRRLGDRVARLETAAQNHAGG
jgi:hypothetical protein